MKTVHKYQSDADFLNALQEHSIVAFAQLYDSYSGSLLGIITKIIQPPSVAEDVLKEAFMDIYKAIADYDTSDGRLFTWMIKVTRKLALEKNKSTHYLASHEIEAIDNNCQSIDFKSKLNIDQSIDSISNEQPDVLNLVYYKGWTHNEVAREFDLPLSTVKSSLRTSFNALRKLYGGSE